MPKAPVNSAVQGDSALPGLEKRAYVHTLSLRLTSEQYRRLRKFVTTHEDRTDQRVTHQAEEEPSDSPIGDWQTEGKGTVRIAKCGNALCGFVLGSSNEKGEAILINMKPKTERQWTGGVYSQESGETYYGTMSMKGINTLRVEACALGRFYCSGNNWNRITRRADGLVTSRQVSAEIRS